MFVVYIRVRMLYRFHGDDRAPKRPPTSIPTADAELQPQFVLPVAQRLERVFERLGIIVREVRERLSGHAEQLGADAIERRGGGDELVDGDPQLVPEHPLVLTVIATLP